MSIFDIFSDRKIEETKSLSDIEKDNRSKFKDKELYDFAFYLSSKLSMYEFSITEVITDYENNFISFMLVTADTPAQIDIFRNAKDHKIYYRVISPVAVVKQIIEKYCKK